MSQLEKDFGGLELNPEFQRGHIWTVEQQTSYVENVMRGVVSTAGTVVQFNCKNWPGIPQQPDSDLADGVQCIDGLQRLTSVTEYLDGRIKPFGKGLQKWDGTAWDVRRMEFRFRIAVFSFQRK